MRSRPKLSALLPQLRREAIRQPGPTIDAFAPLREGIQRQDAMSVESMLRMRQRAAEGNFLTQRRKVSMLWGASRRG